MTGPDPVIGRRSLHDQPVRIEDEDDDENEDDSVAAVARCKAIRPIPVRLNFAETYLSGGKVASSAGRCGSNHSGNMSFEPSMSGDSSTANPGGSVAISNKTPPGSR
jgi:hypothetical protein